ncbi:UNVERIFIED_ORG: hypothetical protein BDU10_6011 [Burkholderia sp. CF145]|nr:hypothetical protein SAMN05445504_4136 [Burkholderia sp. CF099]
MSAAVLGIAESGHVDMAARDRPGQAYEAATRACVQLGSTGDNALADCMSCP